MSASPARERMSGVDHAWLRMDRPTNLMQIVGIDVFERPVAFAALRRTIAERLLPHRRFRQRVEVDPAGNGWWVDDARFDLDHHLCRHRLAGAGGDADLQRFVARLAATPLDRSRPLWQFHLVGNYRGTDALVVRIHHCVADGIALVRVLLGLADGGEVPPAGVAAGAARAPGPRQDNPWLPYLQPVTDGAVRAIEAAGVAWSAAMALLIDPAKASDYAQAGGQVAIDAARIALMRSDTPTSLKGVPGVAKAVAWSEPLPLDEIKAVGHALHASVNDVLLSCVSGAIRGYLRGRGEPTEGCELRALVPVNLRAADEPLELGNCFGLVPLLLPVGIANPVARLQEVTRRMDALKDGYQAVLAHGLLAFVGRAPWAVQQPILDYLTSKASAVVTNVPGPGEPLALAGRRLTRMMFWVPQSGDVGLGVSVLSYAGGVQFGVIADRGLCPEPQKLIDAFAPEFERLVLTVSMLPPGLLARGAPDPDWVEHALFH